MNELGNHLLREMDIAVLEQHGELFGLQNDVDSWFFDIWPDAKSGGSFSLAGPSPFIDNFLVDAEEHWLSGEGGFKESGAFLERGLAANDYPLEARAWSLESRRILLIVNLGESFTRRSETLQIARNNLLTQEVLEAEVSKRTQEIRQREAEIAGRLIYASGFRDEETGAHIRRIGLYSAEMGRALGWTQMQVDDIEIAAPMHDLGKIGIPDRILKKPATLTEDEQTIMRRHPTIGAKILEGSDIPMIQMAAEIAGSHHERWDGTGYPDGVSGPDIPIAARIVAIVDVYDALVHQRVYKDAWDEERAIAAMRRESGKHFDPVLLELFCSRLEAMRAIRKSVRDDYVDISD